MRALESICCRRKDNLKSGIWFPISERIRWEEKCNYFTQIRSSNEGVKEKEEKKRKQGWYEEGPYVCVFLCTEALDFCSDKKQGKESKPIPNQTK